MRLLTASFALALPLALSSCGSDEGSSTSAGTPPPSEGGCPTTPVDVVVSVDQWGDIVSQVGGACADVTTVLASSSVDPHDFEPTPLLCGGMYTATHAQQKRGSVRMQERGCSAAGDPS